MNKTLAILCAVFALQTSKAVPALDVSFSQDNWMIDLLLDPSDIPFPPDGFIIYEIDGVMFNGDTHRWRWNGPLPVDYASNPMFAPGEHSVKYTYTFQGIETILFGDETYTIVAPTGERPPPPAVIPDGGSTLALMAMGTISMLRLRSKLHR